jgi:integrase/recombinase XerD
MARAPNMQLPYATWPEEDRKGWSVANKSGADPFDDCGPAAHLAEPTRRALQGSYGRFLGFLSIKHPGLLARPPGERINRKVVTNYVAWRRRSCGDSGIAIDLHHLRLAVGFICPGSDLTWLLAITKRISAQAPRNPPRHHLVTSERLYTLGMELMDHAVANADARESISKAHAFEYRDGLIIALLAVVPLRRRTLAALRIGKHLVKSGKTWSLDIPAEDTKTRRSLEYPISAELSERINLYLTQFRCRIPGASAHDGLWAAERGRPMDNGTIYSTVRRRTQEAFGFPVNLHRFRHAAATFWSSQDPANIRGAKDLLGQSSFGTTEKHYIMAQTRMAGRALARAIGAHKSANRQPDSSSGS